jgi:hypothetical protein
MNAFGIIITLLIIVLIILLIRYIITDPYTLQNIQNGEISSRISSSSLATNGSNIPSSNFAYSIWFYVNDWNYRYGEPKVVFGRMGSQTKKGSQQINGINGQDPCPAVVLGAIENNISVSLACYPGINQAPTTPGGNTVIKTCSVSDVPIQKWVNLTLSVNGRTMDIYIDGKLVQTCLLPGVASINNNADVYVTPSGGFNGWTSKFKYYPSPLNPQQAWNIYTQGYSSWLSMFSTYQIKFSLEENGQTKKSVTI